MSGLPRSWDADEWTGINLNGADVRLKGITFGEYQAALSEAVRRGATTTDDFCEVLEDDYGAETEVLDAAE